MLNTNSTALFSALSREASPKRLATAIVAADPLTEVGLRRLVEDRADIVITAAESASVAIWDGVDERALLPVRGPVLALVSDRQQAAAVLGAPVRGVLGRDASGEQIASALTAISCKLTVIDPTFELISRGGRSDVQLTAREHEVMQLLATGVSNKRIAKLLAISAHTVKFHVNSILAKFDVDTRTQAVVEAVRAGMVML